MPKEAYEKISKDPHSIYSALDPEKFVPDPNANDDKTPVVEPGRRPQNIQIRYADWLQHGSTVGCSKCTSALEQGWGVYGGSHSQACLERYRNIYASTEEGQMRLDRAQRRLDRRYPENPSRTTAEEHGTQDKVSKGQALPNRLQEDSQDEELKCPTSDEEDKSMMENYEAPSVAADEDMASPEDAIMIVESEILQLVVQL